MGDVTKSITWLWGHEIEGSLSMYMCHCLEDSHQKTVIKTSLTWTSIGPQVLGYTNWVYTNLFWAGQIPYFCLHVLVMGLFDRQLNNHTQKEIVRKLKWKRHEENQRKSYMHSMTFNAYLHTQECFKSWQMSWGPSVLKCWGYLTLWHLIVTCIYFLSTISPLNQTSMQWEESTWSPSVEDLDWYLINSPVSTIRTVWRTVWRKYKLILGEKK